jgi:hypothetical protein
MPLLYPSTLQALLPTTATTLLTNQKSKLSQDWALTTLAFPLLTYETYLHAWLLISTRTFYYTKTHHQTPQNHDDCLAQSPFADYFNHSSLPSAAIVSTSPSGYEITTPGPITAGSEIYISYGKHSNDFLFAEYGFFLDQNEWDEIPLDPFLMEMFSEEQKGSLKEVGFLGKWMLDGREVCYRTQVAVRLLCLPERRWLRFVEGASSEEGDQVAVDEILMKVLVAYRKDVKGKINAIAELKETVGTAVQRDMLSKRWKQIDLLLQDAMDRLEK